MSAVTVQRMPVMRPSAVAASSISSIWARPWVVACMFSLRVSTHFSGRPSLRATATASASSA